VDPFKGSAGGVTFQVAGPSSAVRMRRIPRNYRTVTSSASRVAFTHVRSSYRNLDAGQVIEWNDIAVDYPRTNSLGIEYTTSGTNVFSRLNKVRVQQGLAIEGDATPPASFPSPTIVTVAMEITPNDLIFELDPLNVPADYNYVISASAPLVTPPSNPTNVTVYDSHIFEQTDSTATNAVAGWSVKFGVNSSYNQMWVVITLRQVFLENGDQRELFREVVQIGA
jgi:hypothetical protein